MHGNVTGIDSLYPREDTAIVALPVYLGKSL